MLGRTMPPPFRGPALQPPQDADQSLTAALECSRQEFIQEQTARLAAIQRQWRPRLISTPLGGSREADGSAAGASAAASAVPLELPLADRNSSNGPLACNAHQTQDVDT